MDLCRRIDLQYAGACWYDQAFGQSGERYDGIVKELLWRGREYAKFATVSGKVENETKPEALYRKCGFTGNDVWHILHKNK